MRGRLLCTFVHRSDVRVVADLLLRVFDVKSEQIFVYCSVDDERMCYLTYSALMGNQLFAKNTISIHRNSTTNTFYTVNAMNDIIRVCNNGVMDSSYKLEWELYTDTMLMTTSRGVEKIKIKFKQKITK